MGKGELSQVVDVVVSAVVGEVVVVANSVSFRNDFIVRIEEEEAKLGDISVREDWRSGRTDGESKEQGKSKEGLHVLFFLFFVFCFSLRFLRCKKKGVRVDFHHEKGEMEGNVTKRETEKLNVLFGFLHPSLFFRR
jgi:hypothetical protein